MLKWWLGSLVVTVLVFAGWWAGVDAEPPVREHMMPWQVEVDAQGVSTVFGIRLRETTLAEAVKKFGREGELALFSRNVASDRLEAYFHNVELGPVIAKVVVNLSADKEEFTGMRARSVKQDSTPSGVYRYTLSQEDTGLALQRTIDAITYIPSYLRLDEEMVRSKFGDPQEVLRVDDKQVRWFYPQRGLAVLIDTKGKEIFQYVPVEEFGTLKKRLDDAQGQAAESDA